MRIECNRLDRSYQLHSQEYEEKAVEVLRSGWYVLGNELESFETEFAGYLGSKYCLGVASGLDALKIAFSMLGIGDGDEVIVPANTYIASVMGITMNGATPVFIEPDDFYNINADSIEDAITDNTKAILAVHLYGQAANMGKIMNLASKYKLKVVEDCAQAHGAMYGNKMVGTFGDVGCFSFYPTKNLGCFGDGGAIVTEQEDIFLKTKIYRNYGSDRKYHNQVVGVNSRLDELQAGLLRVRLTHLNELNEERRGICGRYQKEIQNTRFIKPMIREMATTAWHQYVIRCEDRQALIEYLDSKNIHTMIHYPIPPHLSEAYAYLGIKEGAFPITERISKQILSLPLYNGMTKEETSYVIEVLNNFR